MSWWDIFTDPFDKGKEQAFSRVFDGLIESRNAVRSAFGELENAKARLAEFYVQFTALPATPERSEYRRLYQDTLSELQASEKRLDGLGADLATVQEAASAAYAGTRPYDMIAGEIALTDLDIRELSMAEVEEASARLAGGVSGLLSAAIVLLSVLGILITAYYTVRDTVVGWRRAMADESVKIANATLSTGKTPVIVRSDASFASDLNAAAAVTTGSIVLAGLVGTGLYLLTRKA